ncbi:MAG: chromosome segregation protein SMC [Holophagaceae bacterium]
MRLIALELNGFKSFADAQRLVFPGGMTAVVGPNGCGKSNISDALAWVLGEQRASLLRGTEMADVIFAGTAGRKPMGLAEVKLTLEMPDAALPGAVKEVVIARRLYRDTGSEYRVNGREARLKDVQDLLLDTGMGTRAYSFIQQGQIDLILSTKPRDRRSLLEEAAGITRYKLRRMDAERRLEDTRANLTRLDDILHEQGKALDSLRRQAARARRAAELDAEIKATQRILLAGKARELSAARARAEEQLDLLERQLASLTAQASEKASEVEGLRHEVDELQRAQERRARGVMALDQKLSLLEQERGFQEARLQESKDQDQRLGARVAELRERASASQAEIAALEAKEREAAAALEGRASALAGAEEAVALALGALRHSEGELRALRHKRAELHSAAQLRHKQRLAVQNQIAQVEGRLDALNHEEAVRAPRLDGLKQESARLARELEGAKERLEQMDEAVALQAREGREAEDAERAALGALREAEGALEREERRAAQIADALAHASGSDHQKQALQWLRGRGEDPKGVAECLAADEAARSAVERLLGPWIEAVALQDASHLHESPGPLLASLEDAAEAVPGIPEAEPIAPHLRWKAGSPAPLKALLDRAFLCADEALPGLAKAHPGCAFVSPKLVRLPYGPVLAGGQAPAASPLKLRADLDAARAAREGALDRLEAAEAAVKQAAARVGELRGRGQEMEQDRREARLKVQDLEGRLRSAGAQLKEIEEAEARADELWSQFEQEIERLRGLLREMEEHPESQEDAGLEEGIHAAEAAVSAAQAVLEAKREAQLEAARLRDASWSERDGLQRQLGLLQRGAFDLESEAQRLETERRESVDRGAQAAARLGEMEGETQGLLEERRVLADQQVEAQPHLEEAQERLRVFERSARELQQILENARQLHQEALVAAAQVQGSAEALSKEIELALGLPVPDFLGSVTEEERAAWEEGELVHQTRLAEAQGKRLDLGGVNPLAVQELQEAEERLAYMNQQRADVMEAIGNLESTIAEINQTSEERFREAFDFVNARFGEVFREAFGGGQASLSLEDPKNLLECGIEITAQPPGKSAKSLTLLSGGEKALTAISLLFAIFHFKPSPFCVLDEVDAPLDEANVGRFAAMVNGMKTGTQFIVITHQKPTMMAADTLYGVTMEEQGVSRLVSVQLREAEALV